MIQFSVSPQKKKEKKKCWPIGFQVQDDSGTVYLWCILSITHVEQSSPLRLHCQLFMFCEALNENNFYWIIIFIDETAWERSGEEIQEIDFRKDNVQTRYRGRLLVKFVHPEMSENCSGSVPEFKFFWHWPGTRIVTQHSTKLTAFFQLGTNGTWRWTIIPSFSRNHWSLKGWN